MWRGDSGSEAFAGTPVRMLFGPNFRTSDLSTSVLLFARAKRLTHQCMAVGAEEATLRMLHDARDARVSRQ